MKKIELRTSRNLDKLMHKMSKDDIVTYFHEQQVPLDEISLIYFMIRYVNESLENNKPLYLIESYYGFIFVGTYKEIKNKLEKVLKMKVFK